MLKAIEITKFKKIEQSKLELSGITALVGVNNSGKSCFLQAIHFGATLAQSQRTAGQQQFPPEKLRYCPTDDFLDLYNHGRLTEGTTLSIEFEDNHTVPNKTKITLTRGRNGVVKSASHGQNDLYEQVSDPKSFFTIYVPGLAGIAIREEYRSDLVVSNGIARGDANLYLRNVLYRIQQNDAKRTQFQKLLKRVFPQHEVTAEFDFANDLFISAKATGPHGQARSLDLHGTGLMQAVQLFAYVTNYEPKLLLLDEPDAHLHPSNQRLLAGTLHAIATETGTQIVLATHSRHLLDALSEYSEAKLYWIKEGTAALQDNWADISILMDLGALDRGEQLLNGNFKYLIWTEDTEKEFLQTLLEANGFDLSEVFIFSYQTSSKIDAAALMLSFVQRVQPGVKLIIHRDRDFMSDAESDRLSKKYTSFQTPNAHVLITKFSDVEGYFVQPAHISEALDIPEASATEIVESSLRENNNEFVLKFRDKREEIKKTLYKNGADRCPKTRDLLPADQVTLAHAMGKLLFARLGPKIQNIGKNPSLLLSITSALRDESIAIFRRD